MPFQFLFVNLLLSRIELHVQKRVWKENRKWMKKNWVFDFLSSLPRDAFFRIPKHSLFKFHSTRNKTKWLLRENGSSAFDWHCAEEEKSQQQPLKYQTMLFLIKQLNLRKRTADVELSIIIWVMWRPQFVMSWDVGFIHFEFQIRWLNPCLK